MSTDEQTYTLTPTRGEAAALLTFGTIADAGIWALNHGEWVPKKDADAKLLRGYLVTLQTGPTPERAFTALRTWLRKQGA